MGLVQSWAGLGRTEAANPDTRRALRNLPRCPSFLPQLTALFPHHYHPRGQQASSAPVELLTYSALWLCTACLSRRRWVAPWDPPSAAVPHCSPFLV